MFCRSQILVAYLSDGRSICLHRVSNDDGDMFGLPGGDVRFGDGDMRVYRRRWGSSRR